MKSNFALSLSFEGIRLVHRAAGGWRLVGDVSLEAADMAHDLALLRDKALLLEPTGLRTKLLLPAEQIKYLTIETSDLSDVERLDAARDALEGATPYAVDDLAFDVCADGAQTHIAAVAHETLAEAEAFAVEHAFDPVSFSTVPGDHPYSGAPFFGETASAPRNLDGEALKHDDVAVVVIGNAVIPAKPAIKDPQPEGTAEETQAEEPAAIEEEPVSEPPQEQPDIDVIQEPPVLEEPVKQLQPEKVSARKLSARQHVPEEKSTLPAPENDAVEVAAKSSVAKEAIPLEKDVRPEVSKPKAPNVRLERSIKAKNSPSLSSKPEASLKQSLPATASVDAPALATPLPPLVRKNVPRAPVIDAPEAPEKDFVPPPVQLIAAEPPADPPPAGFASRRETKSEAPEAKAEPTLRAPTASSAQQNSAPSFITNYGDVNISPSPKISPTITKPKPARTGFLSRRRAKAAASAPKAHSSTEPNRSPKTGVSEAERMTVFGARSSDVRGKPKFLGLMLTAALLVFLAGVAAWASVFLDDGIKLSRFFGERSKPEFSTISAPPQTPIITQELDVTEPDAAEPEVAVIVIVTASLNPDLTPEDSAVLDALRTPVLLPPSDLSQAELEAKYAATGIWPRAPQVPPEPAGLINIDDLYLTGIDPISTAADAIALPTPRSFLTDVALGALASPAAAGTQFALNASGLVNPTVQGTLSPDGFVVYLGRPAVTPAGIPTRFLTEPLTEPLVARVRDPLAGLRPQVRPGALTENYERAQLDGLTRSELATRRPSLRPASLQQRLASATSAASLASTAGLPDLKTVQTNAAVAVALANPPAIIDATEFAVAASVRPDTRPRNFARIVRRAERTAPEKEVRVASAASVAPRSVKPSIPSSASVARQATVKNALNLRKVNLIGIYGKTTSRRALIRLGNGRYRKVTVGDRIDGGRVSAIGQSELRYVKGGRNLVLKMPKG